MKARVSRQDPLDPFEPAIRLKLLYYPSLSLPEPLVYWLNRDLWAIVSGKWTWENLHWVMN